VSFDFLARLQQGPVLGDGGCIFELERRGYVQAGPFTPEVVLEHPEAVLQLHREFAHNGAEVIQALTFYGSRDKLGRDPAEVNRAAVRLAREAAPSLGVAGGLSPTPTFRHGDRSEVLQLMRQHLEAQLEEGVDLLIGETFLWLEEACLALQAMHIADLPRVVTMNIGPQGSRDGFSPDECARRLEAEGAHVIGVNCSYDPQTSLTTTLLMKTGCYLACQPIGYLHECGGPFESWAEFPLELESRQLSRRALGNFARQAELHGVRFIGGCCGVAPYHVRSMAEALGRKPASSAKSADLRLHMIPEVRERSAAEKLSAAAP
jgi:methionine synthase I (cobalamin-dependent)